MWYFREYIASKLGKLSEVLAEQAMEMVEFHIRNTSEKRKPSTYHEFLGCLTLLKSQYIYQKTYVYAFI